MKGCPKCGRILPDEDFYRDSARRDGLDCYCKDCRKESNMRYSEVGQERRSRRLAADPEYREKVAEYNRNYQRSHYGGGKNMKVIELEQIRPKECPINNDNCQGCKYYFGIAKHWDSTDVDCSYDEREEISAWR